MIRLTLTYDPATGRIAIEAPCPPEMARDLLLRAADSLTAEVVAGKVLRKLDEAPRVVAANALPRFGPLGPPS